jgi:RND family efflux transporter MFP subunit
MTLIAISSGCSPSATQAVSGGGTGAAAGPPAQPPALVRVEAIKKEMVAPEFRAMGNVRPTHTSIVASGADGIVEDIAEEIQVGAFVEKGTVLSKLRMESTDLDIAEQEAVLAERRAELEEIRTPRKEDQDEAEARKQAAEVTFANARRRLEEIRALNQRGAANLTEVKDAQDNLDTAEQNRLAATAVAARISTPRPETVQQAMARVEAQDQHVAFLKAEKEKRMTKAPFAGYVVEEHTYIGQWLSKGAPVVTLADLNEVEVEVQVDQQYIDQIRLGRLVTLRIQGTGSEDEWTGTVDAVVPRSNWKEGSRSFPVIIRIPNKFDEATATAPKNPALREGMMAEAKFTGDQQEAILVPKDSIVRTSRGNFIYVINPPIEGKPLSVRQVAVTPGISSDTQIQVTGENLDAGMQVVTEGAPRLRPFHTVQIMKEEGTGKSE